MQTQMQIKYLTIFFFVLAPITGLAQIGKNSFSVAGNVWSDFKGSEVNLSYDRTYKRSFFSVGLIFITGRNDVYVPGRNSFNSYSIPSKSDMRYGLFGEYGLYLNKNDSQKFKPFASAIASTKYYYITRMAYSKAPYYVWENDLNLGLGIKATISPRVELFSRYGMSMRNFTLYPLDNAWSVRNDHHTNFDLRFGATFYLK